MRACVRNLCVCVVAVVVVVVVIVVVVVVVFAAFRTNKFYHFL